MRIRGVGKMRRVVRRIRNVVDPGPLILLYHRVAEVDLDPWAMCVTPQHFAEHLDVLQKVGRPVRLYQLNQALQNGTRLPRSIVITFDDGYADNLHNAKPLLERYDVPATVFVASGYVANEHEFWWDELEHLLLHPGTLPGTLTLNCNGRRRQWELDEAANYTKDDRQHHRHWRAWENAPTARHLLYRSLWELLLPLSGVERRKVLDQLTVWSETEVVSRPTHRPLLPAEVLALSQEGLVEIGAHTVTHPFLSALPVALQQDEVKRSKAYLEKITGHPVDSFAYPHGDYTAETCTVVREAGFACACSTISNVVQRRADRFRLPRVEIKDCDGEGFAKRLSSCFMAE